MGPESLMELALRAVSIVNGSRGMMWNIDIDPPPDAEGVNTSYPACQETEGTAKSVAHGSRGYGSNTAIYELHVRQIALQDRRPGASRHEFTRKMNLRVKS